MKFLGTVRPGSRHARFHTPIRRKLQSILIGVIALFIKLLAVDEYLPLHRQSALRQHLQHNFEINWRRRRFLVRIPVDDDVELLPWAEEEFVEVDCARRERREGVHRSLVHVSCDRDNALRQIRVRKWLIERPGYPAGGQLNIGSKE